MTGGAAAAVNPAQPREDGATSGRADEYACARAWSALTAAHAQVAGQLISALGRACGMAVNEFEILLRLDQARDEGLRLRQLQAVVPLTQPALSRAVARIAARGWLTRAAAPDDGRGVLVVITPAGRDMLRRAIDVHARTIRSTLLDRLTEAEQDMLADVLSHIAAG